MAEASWGSGRLKAVLGVLKILQGVDAGPIQLGLALQVLGLLLEVRFGVLNLAVGQVDLGLKILRIDLEEQVALMHRLVARGHPGARKPCTPIYSVEVLCWVDPKNLEQLRRLIFGGVKEPEHKAADSSESLRFGQHGAKPLPFVLQDPFLSLPLPLDVDA